LIAASSLDSLFEYETNQGELHKTFRIDFARAVFSRMLAIQCGAEQTSSKFCLIQIIN